MKAVDTKDGGTGRRKRRLDRQAEARKNGEMGAAVAGDRTEHPITTSGRAKSTSQSAFLQHNDEADCVSGVRLHGSLVAAAVAGQCAAISRW